MRYIVSVDGQRRAHFVLPTEVAELEMAKFDGLCGDGVIGITHSVVDAMFGVVTNTAKTVLLHKYCSVEFRPDIGVLPDGDQAVLLLWHPKFQVMGYNKVLLVSSGGDTVRASGELGSVLMKFHNLDMDCELYNLYDFLCSLCMALKFNIMRYESVIVYSRPYNCRVDFKFQHTVESERYYTKMWMDVMRKCTMYRVLV